MAIDWTDKTLTEFGSAMGLHDLSFGASGIVQLEFRSLGELTMERDDDRILIYLVREYQFADRDTLERALDLCYWEQGFRFAPQVGMVGSAGLVFAMSIPLSQFVISTVQQTFDNLCGLHESLSNTR